MPAGFGAWCKGFWRILWLMRIRSRQRAEEGSIMVVLVLVDRVDMEVVEGGVRGIGMIGIGGLRQGIEIETETIEEVA